MKLPTSIFSTIDFSEETHINQMISRFKVRILYLGENRNGSVFTKEVVDEMVKTIGGIPVVGYYSEDTEDFTSHDGEVRLIPIENSEKGERQWECLFLDTKPYGFVPTEPHIFWENHLDKDGVVREYLCTEVYLWMGRYPELNILREGKNGQSMELNPDVSTGEWQVNDEGKQVFVFDHAEFCGLCILGKDIEPCFEGAEFYFNKNKSSEFNDLISTLSNMRDELRQALEVYTKTSDSIEEPEIEEVEEYIEENVEIDSNYSLEDDEDEIEPTSEELKQIEKEVIPEDNFSEVIEDKESDADVPSVEELLHENKELVAALNSLRESYSKVFQKLTNLETAIAKEKAHQEKLDYLLTMKEDMSEERYNSLLDSIDSITLEELKNKAVQYGYEYFKILKSKAIPINSEMPNPQFTLNVDARPTIDNSLFTQDWMRTVYTTQIQNK